MIKSLLDDDEPQDEESGRKGGLIGKRLRRDEFVSIDLSGEEESASESEESIRNSIRTGIIPDPEPSKETAPVDPPHSEPLTPEPSNQYSGRTAELERKLKEIEEELQRERERESGVSRVATEEARPPLRSPEPTPGREAQSVTSQSGSTGSISTSPVFEPEPQSEVFRRSGLAWSAAIALFGSVVFMLVLGWFADLLLGSSPWGIVAGIVVGSVLGFFQFFRITSQILKPKASDFDKVSLRARDSTDEPGSDSGLLG